jgi:hypothetical protein
VISASSTRRSPSSKNGEPTGCCLLASVRAAAPRRRPSPR